MQREILYDRTRPSSKDTSDAARDFSANSSIRRLWQAPTITVFDEVVQGLPTEDQGKVESDVDYVRDTLSGTMMKPIAPGPVERGGGPPQDARHPRRDGERARQTRPGGAACSAARAYLVVSRTQRAVGRDGFFSFEGRRYACP